MVLLHRKKKNTKKNPHKNPQKVQDSKKSHELGQYHTVSLETSVATLYQQLLTIQPQLDDNCPKADGSPSCRQAVSPCFSAPKLGGRETQEQTPINQNENSATTCNHPLLVQTSDLPMHQAKIPGGIREQI